MGDLKMAAEMAGVNHGPATLDGEARWSAGSHRECRPGGAREGVAMFRRSWIWALVVALAAIMAVAGTAVASASVV
jgi:hypothetical protein